jgi:hypothetical protein
MIRRKPRPEFIEKHSERIGDQVRHRVGIRERAHDRLEPQQQIPAEPNHVTIPFEMFEHSGIHCSN